MTNVAVALLSPALHTLPHGTLPDNPIQLRDRPSKLCDQDAVIPGSTTSPNLKSGPFSPASPRPRPLPHRLARHTPHRQPRHARRDTELRTGRVRAPQGCHRLRSYTLPAVHG